MESDNKFENDTGGMSVDEIIADMDRKTANAAALEENSVGVTPEGEIEMSDEQAAVSADEADTAAVIRHALELVPPQQAPPKS